MDDNYKNDGLEDFFRKRLAGFEEPPKPEMWNKIAFSIPPKPPLVWWKKPIWWMASSFIVGLVIFLGQWNKINQYKQIINEQKNTIIALETPEVLPSEVMKAELSLEGASPITKKDINTTSKNKIYSQTIAEQSVNVTGSEMDESALNNERKINEVENKVGYKIDSINDIGSFFERDEKKSIPVELLEKAPIALGQSMNGIDELMKIKPSLIITPNLAIAQDLKVEKVTNISFYFAFQLGSLGTSFNDDFLAQGTSNSLSGSEFGFQLSWSERYQMDFLAGLQLNNKWSFELGVGTHLNNFGFIDSRTIIYSADLFIDTNAAGDPIGTYNNRVGESPVINYALVNNVEHDGNDIKEGDFFSLDTYYDFDIVYTSIPFWAKYRLGNKRFHGFVKAGVSWNLLSSFGYYWANPNVSFDRIILESVSVSNDGVRESFFEVGFAGGIEYDIGRKHSVGFETNFFRSLSPVLGKNQTALGFGLSYKYKL